MNNQPTLNNSSKSDGVYDQYLSTCLEESFVEPSFEATAQGYEWVSKYLPAAGRSANDKQLSILDLGCGMGHFLYFLKTKGYTNFEGVEIGREAVDFVKQNVTEQITLVEDTNQFLKERPAKYDLVTMFNVIEHLPKSQILKTLKACYGALKNGGQLIVTTGNMVCFTSLTCRYQDFTHELGFTEDSLKQVLRIAGFNKIEFVQHEIRLRAFTPQAFLGYILKHLHRLFLRMICFIERPGVKRPKILSYILFTIAEK